jgi:two-component system, chemotaxis family, response regulator Rcp1
VKAVAILLIEDDPGDTRLVEEALKTLPVPVQLTVATDGEKALSLLTKEEVKPDLVILDLSIPKVSGISVLEQYQPKGKPPLVVFSSTWGQIDIRRALELGAREVVHKPMDVQAFIDAVCGMVRKWGLGGGQSADTDS